MSINKGGLLGNAMNVPPSPLPPLNRMPPFSRSSAALPSTSGPLRYNTTADRQVALMMEHAREMVKSRLWRRGGGAGDGAVFLLTDLKAKALEEHEGFHDGVRALQALVHNATARRLWLKRLSDFPTEKKWGRARFQALPAQEADAIIESYVAAAAPGGFVGAPDSTFAGTIRQLREYTKAYE